LQQRMTEIIKVGRTFAFLLVDKFPMFSLAAAIDTMRTANRMSERPFYSWLTVSSTGAPVTASNGLQINVEYALADLPASDIFFICAGLTTQFEDKPKVIA